MTCRRNEMISLSSAENTLGTFTNLFEVIVGAAAEPPTRDTVGRVVVVEEVGRLATPIVTPEATGRADGTAGFRVTVEVPAVDRVTTVGLALTGAAL